MNSILEAFVYGRNSKDDEVPSRRAFSVPTKKAGFGGDHVLQPPSSVVRSATTTSIARDALACLTRIDAGKDESLEQEKEAFLKQVTKMLSEATEKLTNEEVNEVWELGKETWNKATQIGQSTSGVSDASKHSQAEFYNTSCVIFLAMLPYIRCTDHEKVRAKAILFQRLVSAGLVWAEIKDKEDKAEFCFSKASDMSSFATAFINDSSEPCHSREECFQQYVLLFARRARIAMDSSQEILFAELVSKCKQVSKNIPADIGSVSRCDAAEGLYELAKFLLDGDFDKHWEEAIALLETASEVLGETGFSQLLPPVNETRKVHVKILKYLTRAHLKAKKYTAADNVIGFLKKMIRSEEIARHSSLSLMEVEALLGLERYEEALHQLEAMGQTSNVRTDWALGMIKLCYRSCKAEDKQRVLSSFMNLALATQSQELVLKFMEHLLLTESPAQSMCMANQEAAISTMGEPSIAELFSQCDQGRCDNVFSLFFSTGSSNYQAGSLQLAEKAFQVALLYADMDASKARAAKKAGALRCLSLVLCKLGDSSKAAQHLNRAKDIDPENINNATITLSLCLAAGQAEDCRVMIDEICSHSDYHHDYLTAICKEAVQKERKEVAKHALCKLYERLKKDGIEGSSASLSSLLRCIISLTPEGEDSLEEVSHHFEEANLQFTRDQSAFLADAEVSDTSKWFAVHAWNAGLRATAADKPTVAARAMRAAAEFSQHVPGQESRTCESLLCYAVSYLRSTQCDGVVMDVGEFSRVVKALEACYEQHKDALEISVSQTTSRHLLWLKFEIACHTRDAPGALQHLSELKQIEHDPVSFLQLARSADPAKVHDRAVKTAALKIALQQFQGALPVDYKGVACCIRELVELRHDDEQGVHMTAQALEILRGGVGHEYPAEEVQWLVTRAWNRGTLLLRFGYADKGKKWCEAAASLVDFCPILAEGKAEALKKAWSVLCEEQLAPANAMDIDAASLQAGTAIEI